MQVQCSQVHGTTDTLTLNIETSATKEMANGATTTTKGTHTTNTNLLVPTAQEEIADPTIDKD